MISPYSNQICPGGLARNYFIEQEKWKAHDHWQAYAFCSLYEITLNESYLIYALINTKGYLDFIKQRITTYPTLLEL